MGKSFSRQFEDKVLIGPPGHQFWVIDVIPDKLVGPPVLFAPGWNESFELRRGCIEALLDSGRRVVSLEHSMTTISHSASCDFPAVESIKADSLLQLLKYFHIDRVDVVTHSEGALNVVIATIREPNLFRRMVMVAPAGLSGRDNPLRIGFGFMRHLMLRKESVDTLKMVKQIFGTGTSQSRLGMIASIKAAWREGAAMAHFDVLPLLLQLEKQRIEVTVILGNDDLVFPLPRVLRHLEAAGGSSPNFGLSRIITLPGGHEFYTRPPHRMKEVIELLSD